MVAVYLDHIDSLQSIVDSPLSPSVIDYVVSRVSKAVQLGLGRPLSSSPSSSSSSQSSSSSKPSPNPIPTTEDFTTFTTAVFRRAEVKMSVVLGTLVYIERAMPYLRISIEEYSLHRVLLGALILASKYLNDSSLKNAHWALCTQLFGKRDIGRIEREFLVVLDWELGVKEKEVLRVSQEVRNVVRLDTMEIEEEEIVIVNEYNNKQTNRNLAPIDTSTPSKPHYKTHHRGNYNSNSGISPAFSSTSSCESLSPPPRTPGDGISLSSSSSVAPKSAPTKMSKLTLPPIQSITANINMHIDVPPPHSLPMSYHRSMYTDAVDVDVDMMTTGNDNSDDAYYPQSVKKLLDSFPLPTLPQQQQQQQREWIQPSRSRSRPQSSQLPYLPAYQFPEVPISV